MIPSLAIIGAGHIGSALADGLITRNFVAPANVLLIDRDPDSTRALALSLGCHHRETVGRELRNFEVVVLAVKPVDAPSVLTALAPFLNPEQLVISVMAGITIDFLTRALGGHRSLVRCMPNTPARIGRAVTPYFPASELNESARALAAQVLGGVGEVLEVRAETLLDSATAISGSGPAYLFYLLEHYLAEAEDQGFSPGEAEHLIQMTFDGALALWRESKLRPHALREQVTSRGGTTAAALEVFARGKLGETFREGISRARERARELSRGASSEKG